MLFACYEFTIAISMPFLKIILFPLNIATRTVCVMLISEVLLLLRNPIKKITNVQFKRETCHAEELTITRKTLGLIWTGVTFNGLKQLLLKPRWVNLEFRTLQWTISSHDPPHRKYLPVPTPALTFKLRLLVCKTWEFSSLAVAFLLIYKGI